MVPTYSLMPDSWRDLARALVAELMGTMFLVIIGCGAAVNWKTSFDVTQVKMTTCGIGLKPKGYTFLEALFYEFPNNHLNHIRLVQVSLAFGLAVMAIASFTGHVSGGQFAFCRF